MRLLLSRRSLFVQFEGRHLLWPQQGGVRAIKIELIKTIPIYFEHILYCKKNICFAFLTNTNENYLYLVDTLKHYAPTLGRARCTLLRVLIF